MSVLAVVLAVGLLHQHFRNSRLQDRIETVNDKAELVAEEQRRRSETIARSEQLESQVREIRTELREALKITPSDVYKLLQEVLKRLEEKDTRVEN